MMLTKDIDACYSPDDETETGKGWYLHDYDTNKTSQLFNSAEEAEKALNNNTVVWET